MIGPALPPMLAPPAPFPLVVSQTMQQEDVAPGIRRATYAIVTSDGPLAIDVVAIDPREPTVRLGVVLARDRLVSQGETISSMARRSGAVAGVNADYFDIGQTNQPLNVVVRDGRLVRTPSRRIALDVRTDRSVHIENVAFAGAVRYGKALIPLTGVNEYPPQGGAALLSSAFGPLAQQPGVTLVSLRPAAGGSAAPYVAGTYRVVALSPPPGREATGDESSAPMPSPSPAALPVFAPTFGAPALTLGSSTLALGPAALAIAPPPALGELVKITASTVPELAQLQSAVGGGPLLVQDGAVANDPNAPAPEETAVRFPVSGAALGANGSLLMISVGGRSAASIGLTRPEFAALMLGLGARDGLAFDSGGSATLVARRLGEASASVLNAPSDGEERPVADGLFAYSDAPRGPAASLVVRPSRIVALPGVTVPVAATLVDAAGHDLGAVVPDGGATVDAGTRTHVATVRAAGLVARVPVRIVPRIERLEIRSAARNVEIGLSLALEAVGTADDGAPVALGADVEWSAEHGGFDAPGRYHTTLEGRDDTVTAKAGGAAATYRVRVGSHIVPLPYFDLAHAAAWRFAAAPSGTPGAARVGAPDGTLAIDYDFTSGQRAAYARTDLALPGEPLRFSVEVVGDGNRAGLRATFVNVLGERRALTLARTVDWTGSRTLTLDLPNDLNPPIRLVALYVVPPLGGPSARSLGTISFAAPTVTVIGRP